MATTETAAHRSFVLFGCAVALLIGAVLALLWGLHLGVPEGPNFAVLVPNPTTIGYISAASAIVVVLTTAWTLLTARWFEWAWSAAVVGLLVMVGTWLFSSLRTEGNPIFAGLQEFPFRPGLVWIVAGWLLAQFGCAVVLIAAAVGRNTAVSPRDRAEAQLVLAGFTVGLLVLGVVAGQGNRIVNASNAVESVLAAESSVPPLPDELGPPVFSLNGGDIRGSSQRYRGGDVFMSMVVAAGPGFVTRFREGVRGYDSAGNERWRYVSRNRPFEPTAGMRAFDDGQTVIVQFADRQEYTFPGRLVALDAATGRVLWTTTDETMVRAFENQPDNTNSANLRYLIQRESGSWTAVNTRTGTTTWTAQVPADASQQAVDVTAGPGYFTNTSENGVVRTRFVVLESGSGEQVVDRVVLERPDDGASQPVVRATPAGRDGVAFTELPAERWRYLNVGTDVVIDLESKPVSSDPHADLFVEHIGPKEDRWLRLRVGVDARFGCILPDTYEKRIGWLTGQIVLGDKETPIDPVSGDVTGGIGLTAYRTADCEEAGMQEATSLPESFLAAPGVFLMLSWPNDAASDELTVTGYAAQ